MAKKISQVQSEKLARRRQFYLVAIPVSVLLIKVIIMTNIKAGAWLGADGENYLVGVEGLQSSGFFSDESKLSFWPAGYPLLMWPFAEITTAYFFYIISFIQSLFFAFATYFFTKEVSKSQMKNFAVVFAIFISLNPTLSLGTLAIGYEAPVASCFLMVLGLSLKFISQPTRSLRSSLGLMAQVSGWFALMIFMQPKFLLVAFVFFLLLVFQISGNKIQVQLLSLGLIIVLMTPAIMMFRNYEVSGKAIISNNLGVTMAIGAGPSTSGSYVHEGPEIPCDAKPGTEVVSDNQRVKCVIEWYLKNPLITAKLAFNKSMYFWSPWTGPLANGTMARNPWLKISPAYTTTKNQEGSNLVLGPFGKSISYLWIIGQIFFLVIGFLALRRRGEIEKKFAWLLLSPVLISWAISIGTIGDHRFRVPTMSLSLVLQAIAFQAARNRISKAI